MANPFPGMDPYLEGELWTTFHTAFAVEITRQLVPKLRPKYAVLPTERVVIASPDQDEYPARRWPDVGVVEEGPTVSPAAVAAAAPPLTARQRILEEVPLVTVEIRDTAGRRLVTAIEVLSSTNKRGAGAGEYAGKRQQLLASTAHLIEIDLIRRGERFPVEPALPSAPYFVFVSRAEHRPEVKIWPIGLAARLPQVPVPLLADDPDSSLDLQDALTGVYDLLGYDRLLDYSKPPPRPAMTADDLAWIEQRLRAAGKR